MDVNSTSTIATGFAGQGGSAAPVHAAPKASAPVDTNEAAAQNVGVSTANVVHEASNSKSSSDASSQDQQEKKQQPSDKQILQAVSQINKKAQGTEAIFGVHEKTNRTTIKIVDKKTKDVIKEIPSEEALDMIAKQWEIAGLLVDEKR